MEGGDAPEPFLLAQHAQQQVQVVRVLKYSGRDEDPEFFSTDPDPDPAQLKKKSGSRSDSGSDLKSK